MLGWSVFLAGDKSSDGLDHSGEGLLGVVFTLLRHESYVVSYVQMIIILFTDNARRIEKVLRAASD